MNRQAPWLIIDATGFIGSSGRLEPMFIFDLASNFYDDYPAIFERLTADDLLGIARRHIHPDRLAIVAVGPADELRPQLEEIAPVTVHDAEPPTPG